MPCHLDPSSTAALAPSAKAGHWFAPCIRGVGPRFALPMGKVGRGLGEGGHLVAWHSPGPCAACPGTLAECGFWAVQPCDSVRVVTLSVQAQGTVERAETRLEGRSTAQVGGRVEDGNPAAPGGQARWPRALGHQQSERFVPEREGIKGELLPRHIAAANTQGSPAFSLPAPGPKRCKVVRLQQPGSRRGQDLLPYPATSPAAGYACRKSMLRCAGASSHSSNWAGGRITTMRFSSVGL